MSKKGKESSNQWLQVNQKKIDAIQYKLTEVEFKNEAPQVPIKEIRLLLNSIVNELDKLQNIINKMEKESNKE